MNIRFVQASFTKLHSDNVLRFLYDLLVQDLHSIVVYETNVIYKEGDKVYLQEDGKHQIYQCMVSESSNEFIKDEWQHILDVYPDEVSTVANLTVKEECHIITEATKNSIQTNLEFDEGNSSFALYCGLKRYTINNDFKVKDGVITFLKPFNVGDKIILEVRELIGTLDRLILRSTNGLNYEICIVGEDLFICETDSQNFKREVFVRDDIKGINYRLFMEDEDVYFEVTDLSATKAEITILDENETKYRLEVIDDDFLWSLAE